MKFQRHNLILKLIEEAPIETQKELSDKLRTAGFRVTQATVSRDIKELRLVKVLDHDDKYKYAVAAADAPGEFAQWLTDSFLPSGMSNVALPSQYTPQNSVVTGALLTMLP